MHTIAARTEQNTQAAADAATIAEGEARREARALCARLTAREREVLVLACKGLTHAEIAQALGKGKSTIEAHVSNLLAKLDGVRLVEAAVIATRAGLV